MAGVAFSGHPLFPSKATLPSHVGTVAAAHPPQMERITIADKVDKANDEECGGGGALSSNTVKIRENVLKESRGPPVAYEIARCI